jgi:hypothetical protein
MKRLFVTLAAAGLLVGLVAGPVAAAPGGVARNQITTTNYTILVLGTYIHNYQVVWNPCDETIAITGGTPVNSGYYTTETITGSLAGGVISFHSHYNGPWDPTYSWSGSFPVIGGALAGDYTGSVTLGSHVSTTWANHGAYVSSMGGGDDVAHSCIGMPIVAQK